MPAIDTSIFELFKIGPGSSSSHTIGPMKAGYDFYRLMDDLTGKKLDQAEKLQVILHGSLAATGKGHGTDRAVLAGLLGSAPETCSSDFLDNLVIEPQKTFFVKLRNKIVGLAAKDIIFNTSGHNFPFSNTMIIRLSGKTGVLLEREYYSVGGGFLQWKGWRKTRRNAPLYPYSNTLELQKQLKKHHLNLPDLMMANEQAITGATKTQINSQLDQILAVMDDAVIRGIRTEGYLPGPIGLHRKAPLLFQRSQKMSKNPDRFMVRLCAYAFAAAEENAAGHIVVTAPTCGSAGILPGVIRLLRHHSKIPSSLLREALLTAAAIGFIAKHNASISGAEVGCQGEVGVASSMAAALIAQAHHAEFEIIENAAETALEHHLGVTCDPVQGYVQIPCIERNAMGAVKAYTAYLIAREGIPEWHLVGLDKAVKAMMLTGRDMQPKYKETAEGGLAKCC
ncbi:MAG: L-serine ammonia-lyase [Deltaproteobacteria bacterium HGW-Deltaproteobacteria-9]|nr:MAG: L-serine ammonia-lyase [Deltaproteobacteria bacterium HGW-Deltaproteobacteria-9]